MDEIAEIKRRAGIKPMVTYAVVIPQLARNGSFNHPTIHTFSAASDDEALEVFNTERRKLNTWQHNHTWMTVGGANAAKAVQLYRHDTGARIDVDRASPKYDPKKPAELQPSVAFK